MAEIDKKECAAPAPAAEQAPKSEDGNGLEARLAKLEELVAKLIKSEVDPEEKVDVGMRQVQPSAEVVAMKAQIAQLEVANREMQRERCKRIVEDDVRGGCWLPTAIDKLVEVRMSSPALYDTCKAAIVPAAGDMGARIGTSNVPEPKEQSPDPEKKRVEFHAAYEREIGRLPGGRTPENIEKAKALAMKAVPLI